MEWASIYLACLVLGLTFVGLSMVAGHFGGDADAGGDGADGGDGAHDAHAGAVHLPLFSPNVLAIFTGMFGAGGLFLLKAFGLSSPWHHVPGAAAISLTSGLAVAWVMMKLVRHAESNSVARHSDVVGRTVEVIASIRGAELGEIAYEAGGTRQTLLARGDGQRSFAQGEIVQVLEVMDGIARVGPPGGQPALEAVGERAAVGVPVAFRKPER